MARPWWGVTHRVFIVIVIDGEENVTLWERAAIISVLRFTATAWNEGKAER